MMLMAGEHCMWVAKQKGHTDWTFTARTYSRWIPDDAPDAGLKAVALWSPSGHSQAANN
jgi:integrase